MVEEVAVPLRQLIRLLLLVQVNTAFYPLQCVATRMALSGSGLAGGIVYGSWLDCLKHRAVARVRQAV